MVTRERRAPAERLLWPGRASPSASQLLAEGNTEGPGTASSDPLEKVSKVGHLLLFERAPVASVVRANLVSRVILIFRVNQATQLLFSTEFSY